MRSVAKIIIVILGIVFIVPEELRPQDVRPLRGMVFTRSGKGFSGYLREIRIGRNDDSLVVGSIAGTEIIPIEDIARVVVFPREQAGSFFLIGAIAGTYIATLIFGQAESQPSAFLMNDFTSGAGLLLTACLGFGVGGGLGGSVPNGSADDRILLFTGNERENSDSRKAMYDLFGDGQYFRRFHFSVMSGHVFGRAAQEFLNQTGNGLETYNGRGSEFNLLRRMQLTYSVTDEFDIGMAMQSASEPTFSIIRYNYTSSPTWDYYNYSSTHSSIAKSQVLNVRGYYAIGIYSPFLSILPKRMTVTVGGGIGSAKVEYSRSAGFRTTANNRINGVDHFTESEHRHYYGVNGTFFSIVTFAQCSYRLNDYLSFGIAADHASFTPKVIPADDGAGFRQQTISGNSSFGFVFGVHL